MAFPFGQTITILRLSRDRYGDPTTNSSTDVEDCAVYPASTPTEATKDTDIVTWQVTAIVPPDTDILATDKVVYNGATYDVVGQPTPWRSVLTGWSPGIEVHLTAVTG